MRASTIEPRQTQWLWHPYIPLGKISAIAGQMGQAKSLLTCYLAQLVSTGGGAVVMYSAEDDPEDTIRPRLEAANADLTRVEIAEEHTLTAAGLAQRCDELGDVKLVTVDPVQAFLPPNVDAWKGQQIRLALEPVRQLAAERGFAVVLVQHLNRRQDGDPLARIADSQGIPQLARSVMLWGANPTDDDVDSPRKVLTLAKSNLARRPKQSAAFSIVERMVAGGIQAPALERGVDVEVSAGDIVADHETVTAKQEAIEWLRDRLADGPVGAKELRNQARDVGISDTTLKRARGDLRVVSESVRNENGIAGWVLRLPGLPGKPDPLDPVGPLDPLAPLGP